MILIQINLNLIKSIVNCIFCANSVKMRSKKRHRPVPSDLKERQSQITAKGTTPYLAYDLLISSI